MERSERDKPEQTDAGPARDQVTLPPPPSPEVQARTFAEAKADVQADNEQRPRRDLDPPEERERDKWDDPETTIERIEQVEKEGHGVPRHLKITDDAMRDRLGTAEHDQNGVVQHRPDGHVKKQRGSQIDPETGTAMDATTGRFHRCGPYATRFNDPADYCRADEVLRARAESGLGLAQSAPVASLFADSDPNRRFTGYYQDPVLPEHPDGSPRFKDVDFRDSTIFARYGVDQQGGVKQITMFVEPDRDRNK